MNRTEKIVMNFFHTIELTNLWQLSIEAISERIKLKVSYWNHSSALAKKENEYYMFIDGRKTPQKRWQDFGHEMYHYFYDGTNYNVLKETYATYGESKADYFSYHFCVPTFMLQNLKGIDVYDVVRLFNVEFDFALRRMEMYKSKMISKNKMKATI